MYQSPSVSALVQTNKKGVVAANANIVANAHGVANVVVYENGVVALDAGLVGMVAAVAGLVAPLAEEKQQ